VNRKIVSSPYPASCSGRRSGSGVGFEKGSSRQRPEKGRSSANVCFREGSSPGADREVAAASGRFTEPARAG